MSERGAAFGPFLLGLGLGAVLGFLFAPEPGEVSRTKLSHKLRGLRDLAAEKAGELGELLETAEDEEEDAPTARVAIERRLTEATTRRRGATRRGSRPAAEDDPAPRRPGAERLDLAMVSGTGTRLVRGARVATGGARNAASVSRGFAIDWLWRVCLELTAFALGDALFFVGFKFLPSRRVVWRTAPVAAV